MNEHDDIARRAYRLWEANGRPDGRDLEFWLQAENEAEAAPDVPTTNLDRALPPAERTRARAGRHEASARPGVAGPPDHYMAVVDRAHLRIYRVYAPRTGGSTQFELAEAVDMVAGHQQATARATDMAGRFPGGSGRLQGSGGGTIDERLPMHAEYERRVVGDLVHHLTRFFSEHYRATWDFAAGPEIHQAVLNRLPAEIRARVDVAIVKELPHQTPAQLRAHLGL
jgi:hypothetical protein